MQFSKVFLQKLSASLLLKKSKKLQYSKNQLSAPMLIRMNPVHNLPCHSSKINCNGTFLSTLMFSKWPLFFSFSYQDPLSISPLLHAYHILRSFHLS